VWPQIPRLKNKGYAQKIIFTVYLYCNMNAGLHNISHAGHTCMLALVQVYVAKNDKKWSELELEAVGEAREELLTEVVAL